MPTDRARSTAQRPMSRKRPSSTKARSLCTWLSNTCKTCATSDVISAHEHLTRAFIVGMLPQHCPQTTHPADLVPSRYSWNLMGSCHAVGINAASYPPDIHLWLIWAAGIKKEQKPSTHRLGFCVFLIPAAQVSHKLIDAIYGDVL